MKTKIYVLQDENGTIRYIGKTVRSLSIRLCQHFSEVRNKTNHKANWIKSLLSKGQLPAITLIGEVEGDGCKEEIAWIKYFRDEGIDLINGTNGGDGGIPTLETRQKLSLAHKGHISGMKGKHHSERTKLKISKANKGKNKKISKEESEKRSLRFRGNQFCKGRYPSEITRLKMSLAHKGFHHSAESKQKISLRHIGLRHTEEAKVKIGIAGKGRIPWNKNKPWSKETALKISLTKKGIRHSRESKLKMSQSAIRAWKIRKDTKYGEQSANNKLCV